IRRDFPVALLIPLLTGALFLDGELSRIDGLLLFVAFTAWLVAAVIEARRQRSVAGQILATHSWPRVVIYCLAGLASLLVAARLIVIGARGMALDVGVDDFIIGAPVVAVGTSVPELTTAIIAELRGHDEVGLGTIIGSNIFNGGFIV